MVDQQPRLAILRRDIITRLSGIQNLGGPIANHSR
jgi:hypothetical protein